MDLVNTWWLDKRPQARKLKAKGKGHFFAFFALFETSKLDLFFFFLSKKYRCCCFFRKLFAFKTNATSCPELRRKKFRKNCVQTCQKTSQKRNTCGSCVKLSTSWPLISSQDSRSLEWKAFDNVKVIFANLSSSQSEIKRSDKNGFPGTFGDSFYASVPAPFRVCVLDRLWLEAKVLRQVWGESW